MPPTREWRYWKSDWASQCILLSTVGSRHDARPRLTFQAVAEPKRTKVRIHLDVEGIDAGRASVEALGGHWTGERHDYDEGIVMVMRDPEGNEFCIVQHYR